jgi:hypothetical protein
MENLMWLKANLKVQFYQTDELEVGMLFMNSLYPGTDKEYVEVWELEELPENQTEFMEKNGFPVTLYVTIEKSNPDEPDEVIAHPHQIYWIDRDIYEDELDVITVKDVNQIIQNFGGEILIMIDEDEFDTHGTIVPYMEKDEEDMNEFVILKINYETEEEEDIYEED